MRVEDRVNKRDRRNTRLNIRLNNRLNNRYKAFNIVHDRKTKKMTTSCSHLDKHS